MYAIYTIWPCLEFNDIESIGNVYVTAKGSDWDSFTHKQKNAIEDFIRPEDCGDSEESTAFELQT